MRTILVSIPAVAIVLTLVLAVPLSADHEEPPAAPGEGPFQSCSLELGDVIEIPSGDEALADLTVLLGVIRLGLGGVLKPPDLLLDGRPVSAEDLPANSSLDLTKVQITLPSTGMGAVELHFETASEARPGTSIKVIFDMTNAPVGPVMQTAPPPVAGVTWRERVVGYVAGRFASPVAQGPTTPLTGPNFREDVVIVGQLDAGGATVAAIVGGSQRPVPGATMRAAGRRINLSLPTAALVGLGVARAGVRVIFATEGPAPRRIYDRVPDRGSIQLGLRGRDGIQQSMIRVRVDVNGDRRDDLFYLDANGNGMIDSAASDRTGDGRIAFMEAEGPFLFTSQEGRVHEFNEVRRLQQGRLVGLVLQNAQMVYVTIVEDRNANGRLETGEFVAYALLRR